MKIDWDSINRQNVEFDAVSKLSHQWARLQFVPVVDDDYPEVRREYELAMNELIVAIRANGRIP